MLYNRRVATLTETNMQAVAGSSSIAEASKEEQFSLLVKKHVDEIYNFAYHMVFEYDEAQEVSQKTFLSLYQNVATLDFSTDIRPWLFRVARNHCLDYLKKKKPQSLFSDQTGEETDTLDVPTKDPAMESKLDDNLFQERVRQALSQLPVPLKEILALKYFEDMNFEEIGQILDLPVGTVKSQFYRGKGKLYEIISAKR